MAEREVPVLVVGGSLVGLTTSALLASYGVPHVLVERHRGTAIHPRAASFHQRTMEVFRSIGLQQSVEAAAQREFVQGGAIVSVESLTGKELAFFYHSYNEGVEGLSPTSRLFITQVGLEPLLRARATELGAEHHYGTEMVRFEQDDDGVLAVLRSRDNGSEETIRADYLVAADGAHSPVRERLGITMQGRGTFADCVTIYFRADVRAMLGDRNLSVVYVNHPELLGFFRFTIDADGGFLAVFATIDPDGTRNTRVGEQMPESLAVELVRTALGAPADCPVAIDSVQRWSASAATASALRSGRVFLAGDAAHVMPPTGGFGGNTGVADAHNLAWKLAMVSRGLAGPGLLDTYEPERRPICHLTVEQAYTRYVLRVDQSLPRDDLAPPLDDPSIELGAIYRSAAVAGADARAADLVLDDPRNPSGAPGTRLPHVAVQHDGKPISTHDLVGSGFAVLAGAGGGDRAGAADTLGETSGIPLRGHVVAPDGDVIDADGTFARILGLDAGDAVVVRPDGVIGARLTGGVADPLAEVAAVMERLTFRPVTQPVVPEPTSPHAQARTPLPG